MQQRCGLEVREAGLGLSLWDAWLFSLHHRDSPKRLTLSNAQRALLSARCIQKRAALCVCYCGRGNRRYDCSLRHFIIYRVAVWLATQRSLRDSHFSPPAFSWHTFHGRLATGTNTRDGPRDCRGCFWNGCGGDDAHLRLPTRSATTHAAAAARSGPVL